MEKEEGRHIPIKELAARIGIYDKYFNNIYNGNQAPSAAMIEVMADFWDDPRFYDAAGMDRPDPLLRIVIRKWGQISVDTQRELVAKIEEASVGKKAK